MKDGWYKVEEGNGVSEFHYIINDSLDYGAGIDAGEATRRWGYTYEPAIVMTVYSFNKNMQDAYNVGKYGPIEVTLEDLLYEITDDSK